MRKNKRGLLLIIIMLTMAGTLLYKLAVPAQVSLAALHPAANKRILIISPHPDDETIATSGLIMKALMHKDTVRVVVMTYGNSYLRAAQFFTKKLNPTPEDFKKLGIARREETLHAMSYLGLHKYNVRFLGYPDGGLIYLWRKYWDYDNPRMSHSLNVNRVPYDTAVAKGASFCGQSVVDSLTKEINAFQPTEIYYPVTFDDHPDHWATGAFVKYVLYHGKYKNIKQYSYLVHRNLWPQPYIKKKKKILSPPQEIKRLTNWIELPLTNSEIKKKDYTLDLYKTQRVVMQPFFWSFIRKTELFAVESPEVLHRVKDVAAAPINKFGIIRGAQANTLTRIYSGEGNIEFVRIAIDNNKIRFILKTRNEMSPAGRYLIQADLIDKTNSSRHFTCLVRNKKAAIQKISKDSLIPRIIKFSSNGSTLDLTLGVQKSSILKKSETILLSAYLHDKGVKDQTELKVFQIK